MKKITLAITLALFLISLSFARQTPHNFPVGIFKVTDIDLKPGTAAFGQALSDLREGTTSNNYEGVNLVQTYQYANYNSSDTRNFWKKFLKQADSVGLKVLIDLRFRTVDKYFGTELDSLNGIIDPLEEAHFITDIDTILNSPYTSAIGGWYLADEPENTRDYDNDGTYEYPPVDPDELKVLYDLIKQEVPSGVNSDVYLAQGAGFSSYGTNPPNNDYGTYSDAFDVLIVSYYYYSANFEDDDIESYSSVWYPTTDPTNPNTISHGSLRAWSYISQKLRSTLSGFPGNLAGKKVFANLVLGEEIPVPESVVAGSNKYKTFNSDFLATHEITHAAIRKVYDLGFDGIFFYDYISSYPSANPEYREDAKGHWITNENYAEVIETEIHDRDWLVTAFSNSSGTDNKTYLSNRGSDQSPAAGYNKSTGSTVVTHLSAADLWGEEDTDFTYVINTNEDRKSIADGDDELIWATDDRDFWITESDHVISSFGVTLDSDQNALSDEVITALTSGDFDGDGDYEVATATYRLYTVGSTPYASSYIYLSEEGQNFKQGSPIYSYSGSIPSTNVPKITALAAGDFDGSGRDKLVTATWNDIFSDLYIYLSDIAKGESPTLSANAITTNTSANSYVSNFAVGDFDGDFKDALASVFRNSSGSFYQLTISEPKTGGSNGNPGWGPNTVWYSSTSYEQLTAITAGDFYNDRKDYLITGFWNSNTNTSNIYQSRPEYESDCIKSTTANTETGTANECNPQDTVDPNTTHLYQNGAYFHPTAMTAASFRESGTGLGTSKIVPGTISKTFDIPTTVALSQNYPNPFNPTTTISYSIKEQGFVTLKVFNLAGQEVATLVNSNRNPGSYEIVFDATFLSSGIYFYELKSGNQVLREKMTLIK